VNNKQNKSLVKNTKKPSSFEKDYHDFLYYKDFYANNEPVLICEGKTDNIYLRAAIEHHADKFPKLASKDKKGNVVLKVRLYNYTQTTNKIMHLSGGTGDLCKFLKAYNFEHNRVKSASTNKPVVLLIDNDDGAHGKGGIYQAIKEAMKLTTKPDGTKDSYAIFHNLCVIPTPQKPGGKHSMIEDFFEPKLLKTKINGKRFNPSNKNFDRKKEYGKYLFATQVVKKNKASINFDGFIPILERISNVL